MSAAKEGYYDCSFVSIHYIICECGETFPSENGLRAHLEKEHPHKRERKEFKCGVCGSIFARESECIAHYELEHFSDIKSEPEHDDGDLEEEPDPEQHDTPMEEVEIEFQDQQIDNFEEQEYIDEYVEQQDFEEDIQEEQEVSSLDMSQVSQVSQAETVQATQMLVKENGKKQYVKPPPLKMVRDVDSGDMVLVLNRSRSNKRALGGGKVAKHKEIKAIMCEVCGRKYASNAALKYHQRIHTGERPYHCHLCPKAFTMPLFLQIHVRTHTGERPFKCPDCPKAFSNRAALLRHDRVHTGVKPYTCPMCYKSFTQSNSMKLHVATVHLKQPAPYKSRSRRMKEASRSMKQQPANKIKPFAPTTTSYSENETSEVADNTQSEEEYEVVISEEVHEDQNNGFEVILN